MQTNSPGTDRGIPVAKFDHLVEAEPTTLDAIRKREPEVLGTTKRQTFSAFQKYRELFDLIYNKFHPDEQPISVGVQVLTKSKMSTVLVEIRIAYKAYCENALGLRGPKWALPYDLHRMQTAWQNTRLSNTHDRLVLTNRRLLTAVKIAPAITHSASVRLPNKNDDPNANACFFSYQDHEALQAVGLLISRKLWPFSIPVVVTDAPDMDTLSRFLVAHDVAVVPNDDGTFNLM